MTDRGQSYEHAEEWNDAPHRDDIQGSGNRIRVGRLDLGEGGCNHGDVPLRVRRDDSLYVRDVLGAHGVTLGTGQAENRLVRANQGEMAQAAGGAEIADGGEDGFPRVEVV